MSAWMWRAIFPCICGCCGQLVTSCYERGHDKACINCKDHFWRCGPRGDKPCDGANLAKGLRGENGSPYDKAAELHLHHAAACKWTHTKMGEMPPRGPERDALCDCGYIEAKRECERSEAQLTVTEDSQ